METLPRHVRLTWKGHTGPVHDLCYTLDGQYVLSSGADRTIKVLLLHYFHGCTYVHMYKGHTS